MNGGHSHKGSRFGAEPVVTHGHVVADGWDDYDTIFTKYFAKLVEVRKEVFGDDYITDEIMFTALEGNVATYGESLTGTEDEFDKNTGKQTSFKSIGAYQTAYGEDYKFTTAVKSEKVCRTGLCAGLLT